MAKVQRRITIELTRREKEFLDNLLSSLYDFEDDDGVIGEIIADIYNSSKPHRDEKFSKWAGTYADITVTDEENF